MQSASFVSFVPFAAQPDVPYRSRYSRMNDPLNALQEWMDARDALPRRSRGAVMWNAPARA